MTNNDFIKRFSAGVFLIAGVVMIFMFIATLGRDKGLARDKFQVTVLYRNIGGLVIGAPTRLAGVNVGSVTEIAFLDEEIEGRQVKIVLNIFNRYKKQFAQGLVFAIRTEGVLGSKIVEIYPVEGAPAIDITRPVLGNDPIDVQDLAKEFSQAAEAFTKTAQEMSRIDMFELSEVMIESSRALLETSKGINGILDEMEDITIKSKRMFDRIEEKVINDELFKVF